MLVAAAQLSPVFLDRDATVERAIAAIHEASARGARLIVFPEAFVPGKFVTGPCHGAQEIIYGEIDLDKVTGPRWQLDVGGHYGRPDVFRLLVNRAPQGQLDTLGAPEAAFGAVADPSSPLRG